MTGLNASRLILLTVLCFLWALSGPSFANFSIKPAGYLGNSGQEGTSLILNLPEKGEMGISGIWADRDMTLWVGGGRVINRVTLSGELIEQFPLLPKGSVVNSKTFTALNDTLYFLGAPPDTKETRLFSLPMKSGSKATPLPLKLDSSAFLSPQHLDGQIIIAQHSQELPRGHLGIYAVSIQPLTCLSLLFSLPVRGMSGVAVDQGRGAACIYIGHYPVDQTTGQPVYSIIGVDRNGNLLDGYPLIFHTSKYRQVRGMLSFIKDAFWLAGYPEIRRVDLKGNDAPGIVNNYHWEFGAHNSQIIEIGRNGPLQLLALSTGIPDAFYLARWDESKNEFKLVRRIGCLPVINSLGLSDDGMITIGTARTQLWYRWDDSPDTPPRNTDRAASAIQGFFIKGRYFSLYNHIPGIFDSHPKGRNIVTRVGNTVPMKNPVSLSLWELQNKTSYLLLTDSDSKQIWKAKFILPRQPKEVVDYKWEPVPVKGRKLKQPTDVFGLTDGRIIVGDEGRILVFKPDREEYIVSDEFSGGDAPEMKLGKSLRFAIDGQWLLLSDTERHRVLWVRWTDWQVLSVFGKTDVPGNGPDRLNCPTLVALRGTKGLVVDAGNQRILKVILINNCL